MLMLILSVTYDSGVDYRGAVLISTYLKSGLGAPSEDGAQLRA
jgi:hypothetical protein